MYYKLLDSVSAKRIGDHLLLYDADRSKEKAVNKTGAVIVRCLSTSNLEEMAAFLSQDFEVEKKVQIEADVAGFIQELMDDGYIERAVNGVASTECPLVFPEEETAPREIDIAVTGMCNLSCRYCFYADDMSGRSDLPLSEWTAFLEEIGGLAVRKVTLSGGEIFCRSDIWNLIDSVIDNTMRYSILTNGTLIDDKTIEQFKIGKRLKRLDSLQVSIDGGEAAVHDKSRGAGSFAKAVRGIKLLQAAGIPVTARLTVNRYNVAFLEETVKFLLEDLGLPVISTNDVVPLGASCTANTPSLSTEQQLKAITSLKRLEERYGSRISAQAGSLASWHYYNALENAEKSGDTTEHFKMGHLSACGCVYNKLAVHSDGTIAPCNMLSRYELGKINSTPISEIWLHDPLLQKMRRRNSVKMVDIPGCQDCRWASFCNGGCPAYPVSVTGDLYKPDVRQCYKEFLRETGVTSIHDILECDV